jgi:hypothetical protein
VVVNRGLRIGRIDVLGIRDVGGDYSGGFESIAVEVKRGHTPFANAAGQAVGYKVFANRVYLADRREKPFTPDELAIASNLGIGLIQFKTKGTTCREALSSPVYQPIERLQLALFAKLHLGRCQLCGSLFKLGEPEDGNNWSNVQTDVALGMALAVKRKKGFLYGLTEIETRKRKLGLAKDIGELCNNVRVICPDCVLQVFGSLYKKEK